MSLLKTNCREPTGSIGGINVNKSSMKKNQKNWPTVENGETTGPTGANGETAEGKLVGQLYKNCPTK